MQIVFCEVLTLNHLLGRFSLRTPGGLTDLEIDQQAVAVLHQGITDL